MSIVSIDDSSNLAVVQLSSPPANRISAGLVEDFAAALDEVEESGARALLVSSQGQDFSAGGDISTWPDLTPVQLRGQLQRFLDVFNRFEHLSIPTVAAVQGLCVGGGLELAIRADIIVAADDASFLHPEQSLGLVTILGGAYRIAERVGRGRALHWVLTSKRVSAGEALATGLVDQVVSVDRLQEEARSLGETLALGATRAHAAHKELMRSWSAGGVLAADAVVIDTAMALFASYDVEMALPMAIDALRRSLPRPKFDFQGR